MSARVACLFLSIAVSLFSVVCLGQPASPASPICNPSALDVHALPPAEAAESPDWRLFVLEFQNIGTSVCTLSAWVDLLPKADTNNNPTFSWDGADRVNSTEKNPPVELSSGNWAHMLIAWVSREAPEISCDEYSGLHLDFSFHPNVDISDEPTVEVRQLWIRSCFRVYFSGQRLGRYTPDSQVPISRWRCDGIAPAANPTFPALTASSQMDNGSGLLLLDAPSGRTMLGDSLQLRLRFPRQADDGCAFRTLRKRESNGATVILVEQCPSSRASRDLPVPNNLESGVLRLVMQNLDLRPAHVGTLTYDVVAQVGSLEAPMYARAQVELRTSDPTPPKQATIVDPLPMCSGSQLKLAALPPVLAERVRALRTYEATNSSTTACALAGVPELRFLNADGSNDPFALWRRCPNCVNDLFAPRPNGRIDLQPGKTAHLLVGATGIDAREDPWMFCSTTQSLEFVAAPGSEPVVLPFGAQDCATIDVSAWRQGGFDHDPLNEQWAKIHEAETSSPAVSKLPDCNKLDVIKMGQPRKTSVWRKLEVGLSMPSRNFVVGQPVPLYVWLDNTGDKPVNMMSCTELNYFETYEFDLYDAYGHRVLRKRDAEAQGQSTNSIIVNSGGVSCLDAPVVIPPHSCVTGDSSSSISVLSEVYDLPPGEYTVHRRQGSPDKQDQAPSKPTGAERFQRDPQTDITFSISQL